jgi:hypothetical protein
MIDRRGEDYEASQGSMDQDQLDEAGKTARSWSVQLPSFSLSCGHDVDTGMPNSIAAGGASFTSEVLEPVILWQSNDDKTLLDTVRLSSIPRSCSYSRPDRRPHFSHPFFLTCIERPRVLPSSPS